MIGFFVINTNMNKNKVLLLVLQLVCILIASPVVEWTIPLGAIHASDATHLATDSTNRYVYVAGSSYAQRYEHAFVNKLDSQSTGSILWQVDLQAHQVHVASMTVTSDGTSFVVGSSIGQVQIGALVAIPPHATTCCFVVRITSDGTVAWVKFFDHAYLHGIRIGQVFGRLYIYGSAIGDATTVSMDAHTIELLADGAYFVAALDQNGNCEWLSQVGDASYSAAMQIDKDETTVLFVDSHHGVRKFYAHNGHVIEHVAQDLQLGTINDFALHTEGNLILAVDANIVMIAPNGTTTIEHHVANNAQVNGITVDASGFVYATGFIHGDFSIRGQSAGKSLFVIKFDKALEPQWSFASYSTEQDQDSSILSNRIIVDSSNNMYICGQNSGANQVQNVAISHSSAFVAKLV